MTRKVDICGGAARPYCKHRSPTAFSAFGESAPPFFEDPRYEDSHAATIESSRLIWELPADCFSRFLMVSGSMNEIFVSRAVRVANPHGLHARPAEMLARKAMEYKSTIEIIKDGHRADAKSILHILTLGACEGVEVVLEARGEDAETALDSLIDLFSSPDFIVTD